MRSCNEMVASSPTRANSVKHVEKVDLYSYLLVKSYQILMQDQVAIHGN